MFPVAIKTVLAVVVLAIAGSVPAAEIRLRSSALCSTNVVRLGHVAEITGDAQIAAALADVPLCPAPAAGHERTLTREDLRRLLALSGLDRKDCAIVGSDQVAIAASASPAMTTAGRQPIVASGVRQAAFEAEAKVNKRREPSKPIQEASLPQASKLTLVERGATVSVAARTAGIHITTSGKALEAGKAGDAINVELADNKQRVLATVVGLQAVEVTR